MANKANSLAHTKWMCKYHIVFTPKYRRKIIYNQYKESIRDIIKQLCAYKGVEIIEGHLMPDHIHMLITIDKPGGHSETGVPTKRTSRLAQFVSTFKRFCNKEYGSNIWQSRYYDHVVRNQQDYNEIWEYISSKLAK